MWIMWNAPGTTWISSLWKEMIFSTLPWISKVQPHGMRIKLFIYSCNEEPPKHCMESSQTIWLSRDGDCWSTIQNVPTIFLAMDLLILWFMLCVSSININYWTMSTKHVLDYGKQRIKSNQKFLGFDLHYYNVSSIAHSATNSLIIPFPRSSHSARFIRA